MTPPRRRSGSALIIVLGFLSFMVVSAVAFAVYMRTERVASSGFHRTASVRQMVKAGLANAIAQIDAAVGDDPFPGLQLYPPGNIPGEDRNYGLDYWRNSVFMPVDAAGFDETVPVLPLEGLAYLPPALVNEVRGTARNTRTAMWQNLDYDIGRFAYVAVNVSDFFDVNKIKFATPRNTGPNGHIVPSHLFQDQQGVFRTYPNSALDRFFENRGGVESSVPFVSLADFNVALFSKDRTGGTLGIYSPFYGYLSAGRASALYSQGGDESRSLVDMAGRMLFVTDSWQHPTNNVTSVIDLSIEMNQPFRKTAFSGAERNSIGSIVNNNSLYGESYHRRLKNDLSLTTIANLYDYLDDNSVPLSLAIPNVERVPMIAVVNGTTLSENLKLTVKADLQQAPYNGGGQNEGESYQLKTTKYKLVPETTGNAMVNVVCMYPFKGKTKRDGETSSKRYKVQVAAKVFFTKPGQNAGGGWSGRCERSTGITPTRSEWDRENSAKVENNCITLISRKTDINNFPTEVFEDQEAVFDTMVTMPSVASLNADLESMFLLEKKELVKQNAIGNPISVTRDGFPKATTFKLLPFTSDLPMADGAQVVTPVNAADAQTEVPLEQATCWGMTLTPHIALWARVLDDAGKTVDLAPASMYDDELSGGAAGATARAFISIAGDGSTRTPMLAATGNKNIVFLPESRSVVFDGVDVDTPVQPFSGAAAAFAALDPRFNHSPEDFVARASGLTRDGYLSEVRALLGRDGRDPDIFMFASDQEYLQSIGELAFLPKVGELGVGVTESAYAKCSVPVAFCETFAQLNQRSNKCHSHSFWRTYPLYRQTGDGYADDSYCLFKYFSSEIEAGDKVLANDVNSFKVNPYSDIEKIRLAVTANTPQSFWASSTNTVLRNNKPPCYTGPGQPKSMDACLKYCFNELSEANGPTISWKDITNITEYVFSQMRYDARCVDEGGSRQDRKDWEDSLANMAWSYGPQEENGNRDAGSLFQYRLGNNSDELHSVDRKMLYSFWHDSMANQQQLFLVFVRVEAVPLGASDSGMGDMLPAQHGGRAVALVWRDPSRPRADRRVQWRNQEGASDLFGARLGKSDLYGGGSDRTDYVPHRTRLLFYHQFD